MLIYDTKEGERSGTSGFHLGPGTTMERGVLRLNLPPGVKLVGFADDMTLMVYGESVLAHCTVVVCLEMVLENK